MDSITHGIAGALLGKALYAGRRGPEAPGGADRNLPWVQRRRVAVFAATFGALFPDTDMFVAMMRRGNGAALEIHRGVTHSVVCLPLFAVALALGTIWVARRRRLASPSLSLMLLIYASALALHIFMDLITSWGTMIWSPLSQERAAWDLTFIIDLTISTIVLLPQIAARAYRRPGPSAWALRIAAFVIFSLAAWVEYTYAGFYLAALLTVIAICGAVLFAPAIGGWGFRIPRQAWCRAGFAVFALYMGTQAVAHHAAVTQVREFAQSQGLQVETLAALPMPPSLFAWNGLIRTADGLYHAPLAWPARPAHFEFAADAPHNPYVEAAKRTPAAERFLWFARFPSIAYSHEGPIHYVDFSDRRFSSSRGGGRRPYTVRITLDDSGKVLRQQWAED